MTSKATAKPASEDKKAAVQAAETDSAQTGKSALNLVKGMTAGGRTALEGMIAVDKAILGCLGETAKSYANLGRESLKAKSMSDLLDLHVAHAHDRIEQNAANTREILELGLSKSKEAYAPVKEVLAPYLPDRSPAA